jgi:hypothetical protein
LVGSDRGEQSVGCRKTLLGMVQHADVPSHLSDAQEVLVDLEEVIA